MIVPEKPFLTGMETLVFNSKYLTHTPRFSGLEMFVLR